MQNGDDMCMFRECKFISMPRFGHFWTDAMGKKRAFAFYC